MSFPLAGWVVCSECAKNFFNLAKEAPYHFEVEKVLETKMKPMFENDPGCEEIRSTVLMFSLRHGKPASE